MHLTRITTAKRMGFSKNRLHRRKDPKGVSSMYMKQKSSFFVAALSLVAFITGNMMGEHGWHAFWKSVIGKYDDSLITYTGTVPPIALVPDYSEWSMYGGDSEKHTYRQVPKDLLVPLPPYNQKIEKKGYEGDEPGHVYSIGHMGSYETGAEGDGSHPGVDIRVPEGTPIRSIANGIVTRVSDDPWGFGKLIVVRHPHMPDPDRPEYETVLHSSYAHLSSQLVSEGDIVQKGQEIGLSGQTGFATGPHLHFQIDRDIAPWHPYWPFSASEAREAGMNTAQAINAGLHSERGHENTVHPMLLVQANYAPAKYEQTKGVVVKKDTKTTVAKKPESKGLSMKERLSARKNQRIALRKTTEQTVAIKNTSPLVTETTVVASATETHQAAQPTVVEPLQPVASTASVASIEIQHDRRFEGRTWEKIRITLLAANGSVVSGDALTKDIHLRTELGDAEFRPAVLSALDFKNGSAEVQMLPRGDRTIVIRLEPFGTLSGPMQHVGN